MNFSRYSHIQLIMLVALPFVIGCDLLYKGLSRVYQSSMANYSFLKKWIDSFRYGKRVSSRTRESLVESITAYVVTQTYRKNRKVFRDEQNKEIVFG